MFKSLDWNHLIQFFFLGNLIQLKMNWMTISFECQILLWNLTHINDLANILFSHEGKTNPNEWMNDEAEPNDEWKNGFPFPTTNSNADTLILGVALLNVDVDVHTTQMPTTQSTRRQSAEPSRFCTHQPGRVSLVIKFSVDRL